MIKVHISPDYSGKKDQGDGGIRRVVEAMIQHFPSFGIEHTPHLSEADVLINHGAMLTWKKGAPTINVNHGLYWSRQPWGNDFQQVNAEVVESMARAVAHTVPSEWVGRAVRRGGFFYPEVVYHGVDATRFKPGTNGGYVLWNKARADYVSDPKDLMGAARKLRNTQFWTTIGNREENVKVLGVTNYDKMKEIVANAGVYLCTARETFGIGTLEAMACGVPVAGWDWGGQSEIIVQGETGYLAPPGDFNALAECISLCMKERAKLSANAMEDARTRWKWEPRIAQYAEIVKRVYEDWYETKRPKVSVIVTAWNLDKYLLKCLDSVKSQTFKDFECLVVDDAQLESTKMIVREYERQDKRFRYLPTVENVGLPGARNYGFYMSRGRLIRHLDADDFLAANALGLEVEALENNPSAHIVYGHLEVVREDGSQVIQNGDPVRSGWPPAQYSWIEQMAHLNQIPSCSMMRREVLERTGGYRTRMKRNEDAEFWCRATSLGFRAEKFTQAVTYYHRERLDSKGALEWKDLGAEPDWTAWFPWRVGAKDYQQAISVLKRNAGEHPKPHLVPFGAQGKPKRDRKFWYVNDYAYPVVSIIVTVGPGHESLLIDALDSIQAQTYPDWECVVVNDTGSPLGKDIMGAPWAKIVDLEGNNGAAKARNAGIRHTRGKFIVWMDADDYWMPWFLEMMVAHAEINDGVIYSDLITDNDGMKIYRYNDFDSTRVPLTMQYAGSSVLTPRKVVEAVLKFQSGWDERIPGMEDWDWQVAVHHLGFCAFRVPEPLFVYRMRTSTKRERDYAKIEEIRAYMDGKWGAYRKGEQKLMCGCSGTKKTKSVPASTMSASGNFTPQESVNIGEVASQMVQLEYVGDVEQTFSLRSRVIPGQVYRFGQNPHHRVQTVMLGDAEYFTGMRDGNNHPLYTVVGGLTAMESHNPSEFVNAEVG